MMCKQADVIVQSFIGMFDGLYAHTGHIGGHAQITRSAVGRVALAESEAIETVEGNIYFPYEAVNKQYLKPSSTTSSCPWKGQARYYTVLVEGQENQDAAWYYPDPKPAARTVKHHVAFWRGVEIIR